jgi:uncharacterized protein YpuA (DUF1002 family)
MNKQDQIELIHDQAITIAEANLLIASLQKENAMMKIKLAPILLQEQEQQEENAKDLAKYMGYNKPRFTDDELTNATVARILSERVGN